LWLWESRYSLTFHFISFHAIGSLFFLSFNSKANLPRPYDSESGERRASSICHTLCNWRVRIRFEQDYWHPPIRRRLDVGPLMESEVDALWPTDWQRLAGLVAACCNQEVMEVGPFVQVKLFLVAQRRLYSIHPVLIGCCSHRISCFKGSRDSGEIPGDERWPLSIELTIILKVIHLGVKVLGRKPKFLCKMWIIEIANLQLLRWHAFPIAFASLPHGPLRLETRLGGPESSLSDGPDLV